MLKLIIWNIDLTRIKPYMHVKGQDLCSISGSILFLLVPEPFKIASCLYINNWCSWSPSFEVQGSLVVSWSLLMMSCSGIRYLNSLLKDICQTSMFLINCKCFELDSCWCVLAVNTSGFKCIHFNFKLAIFYYGSLLKITKIENAQFYLWMILLHRTA